MRSPALIAFCVTAFDRLWRRAPMCPEVVHRPSLNGVTPRRRTSAALLVEGRTDAGIADRLGMNVRTARVLPHARIRSLGRCPHRRTGDHAGQ